MKTEGLLTIENLSHTFGSGPLAKSVLENVSLNFASGEIVIIMGPSGSGKTTFLSLVGALRPPQKGSIKLSGREISQLSHDQRVIARRQIGFIFQSHNLIASLTVCQNVQLPLSLDRTETAASSRATAIQLLKMVGLADHADKIPRQLSGGERQRVAIARALAQKPKLILADEPTASLDKKAGREIVDILHRLSRDFASTVLIVTHDHRILDIADRIILLEDGRMQDLDDRLESLLDGLASAFASLAVRFEQLTQPAAEFAAAASQDELVVAFKNLEEQLNGLSHLKTRADLAKRAELLLQMVGQSRLLSDTVGRFALLAAQPPPELASLSDRFTQALGLMLLTAEEAFVNRTDGEIETLQRLTEDRRETITRIRQTYFDAQKNLSEAGRIFLFDLSNTFTRSVYFLNSLGGLLGDWLRNKTE